MGASAIRYIVALMIRPALAHTNGARPQEPWRKLAWARPLESRYERMPQFGAQHFSMLVTAIIATGIFMVAAKDLESLGKFDKARRATGWVLGVLGGLWAGLSLDKKQRDVRETLPLHLCDVLRPMMALALVTGNSYGLQLSIYWGIVLNPQAIITPDMPYYFEPKWLLISTYWLFHIVALAIPMALLAAGTKLTWKGFGFTAVATHAWAIATLMLNRILGSNYGFLSAHPNGHSVLSIAPWPYNLAIIDVSLMSVFAAMTYFLKK